MLVGLLASKIVNKVPCPSLLVTVICPPCLSMTFLQIRRPGPVPTCLVGNNGSKILSILSCGVPGPSSDILMIV